MVSRLALIAHAPLTPAQQWEDALEAFFARCDGKNLSASTTLFYRNRLLAFTRWLAHQRLDTVSLAGIQPTHLRDFLADERRRCSPQHARHCYVTLRVFFAYLVDDEWIDVSPLAKVDPPKLPQKLLPALTVDQVTALLSTCESDFYGVRDRAILLLLLDTGLRAAELLSLTMDQVQGVTIPKASADKRAGGKLIVMGKGSKQREVFFGPTTAAALKEYLRRREGAGSPVLFVNHYAEVLTYSGLAQLLRRRGKAARLPAHVTHPHALRHTFATLFLRSGGNVFALQRLLGHATLAMTERYLTLTGDDLATAHQHHSPAETLPGIKSSVKRMRLR